ncbi:hypothetical protein FB45DRAFT_830731 [Roridomyces roridus]|uniref:C2H2-type domain-containing protein n=1 Tax=Roridomyces roridus TaxID=1738132 RepID=A0AAD7BZM5_9AGAR|nr:hypothetical protein FB45DRAFT_830731 [Roridomyces roridus]
MAFNLRYVEYPASPDRPFPCEHCPLSFDRQHDLKRHIDTHSGEKPFLCDRGCGKAFTRKDALKRHQTTFPFCPPVRPPPHIVESNPPQQAHPRAAPPALTTGSFPTSFNSGGRYPQPSRYYTPTSPSASHSSGFSSPGYHGAGSSAHSYYAPVPETYNPSFVPPPQYAGDYPASPARPYPCDSCALSFDRHHDLKRHRATHAGDRPYVCNGGCEKTFTRKDALKRHQLSKECGIMEPY